MAELVVPVKGWRKFATMIGGFVARIIGGRQQERLDDEDYESTDHTWIYWKPGDPNEHEFIGTPEEFRWFKIEHPEWFPPSEWKGG